MTAQVPLPFHRVRTGELLCRASPPRARQPEVRASSRWGTPGSDRGTEGMALRGGIKVLANMGPTGSDSGTLEGNSDRTAAVGCHDDTSEVRRSYGRAAREAI
jgi:hypothetical protein